MQPDNRETVSYWMGTQTQTMSLPAPLQTDISADVAIVGAGIAGLTTAYLLAQEGLSVIVIDDGPQIKQT